MPSLSELPTECVLHILTLLPVVDVLALASCCTGLRKLAADDCFWADFAEAKWGPAVKNLKSLCDKQQAAGTADASQPAAGTASAAQPEAAAAAAAAQGTPGCSWQQYCYKRMSARTISCSPLDLLQESYPDPYQHIVCCVLCSRTSGSEVIRSAVAAFFQALPTPTAVLAADEALLRDLLHPLGLQASRSAAVKSVSHGFLACDWQTPAEFHGCGKFVEDSWRIFCRGHRDSKDVSDANLKAYLAWHSRQAGGAAAAVSTQRKQRQPRKQRQQQKDKGDVQAGRRTSARLQQQDVRAARDQAPAKRTRAAAAQDHALVKRTRAAVARQASATPI